MFLNIAALCPNTKTLGPGQRYAIWVQGCCFSCLNCGSPEWRSMQDAIKMESSKLAETILSAPNIQGITISGGEPFLQAEALFELISYIQKRKNLSVICYTGFTMEQLRYKKDINYQAFLEKIDVLIDGPYIDSLNDNLGWRGSSNQQVHFLTGRYLELEEQFITRKRDVEIHLLKEHYLMVGIKPKGLSENNLKL